ncbi:MULTISPECIES: peptidase S58, DmpA [Actinosynnema]|uniref:Peptidase S58, DmpA n=1 Tax=Actinosynnema pretiosum TaxID=42197 RepID=A0A290Z189_9PSEU|nr:peptidase S58, DmpA [Actinosynnema pretiosum]ATE52733.1 peptidase S58, DmpA [Actinosynnema pretiosum]
MTGPVPGGVLLGRSGGAVVLLAPDGGLVAGVDVRGAPTGTRELDLLAPGTLVERVHAVVLSRDGLGAEDGVLPWLAERGRGFRVGAGAHEVVPIVPTLAVGSAPGDPAAGRAACEAAEPWTGDAVVLTGAAGSPDRRVAGLLLVRAALDEARCGRVAASARDGLVRAGLELPSAVIAVATGEDTGTPLDALCADATARLRAAAT